MAVTKPQSSPFIQIAKFIWLAFAATEVAVTLYLGVTESEFNEDQGMQHWLASNWMFIHIAVGNLCINVCVCVWLYYLLHIALEWQ